MSNYEDITLFLYDKNDVEDFNKLKIKKIKKIFIFSPGLEKFIQKLNGIEIIKPDINKLIDNEKKTINTSKNIYLKFEKNIKKIKNLNIGIKENFYNIFFISLFSFLYIHYNSINSIKYGIVNDNQIYIYDNKKKFLNDFIFKLINKKNQGFFLFLKKKKISFVKKIIIIFNNLLFFKKKKYTIIYGKKLALKILNKNKTKLIEIISFKDFNLTHLILNLFEFLKIFTKKKHYYYSSLPVASKEDIRIKKNIDKLLNNLFNKRFSYLEKYIKVLITDYCIDQLKTRKNFFDLFSKIYVNNFFTDQLRYGEPTIIAEIAKKKKFEVFLIPHGSMSVPSDKYSEFVHKISGRGMIFSPLADKVYAQTKVAEDAILFYESSKKVIKSEPILYGENKFNLRKINYNKNCLNFLHVSSPKSLSKWPWIYEDFNTYVYNLKNLINFFLKEKRHKLTIRFRQGPECDLETFKKIVKIDNKFVNLSNKKEFIHDIENNNVLISYSSTAIEEALIYNKPIIIYSDGKNYRHINYKLDYGQIIYSNKNSLKKNINKLFSHQTINYNINW